jgi:hypothetical protein
MVVVSRWTCPSHSPPTWVAACRWCSMSSSCVGVPLLGHALGVYGGLYVVVCASITVLDCIGVCINSACILIQNMHRTI